ncbi:MAG TPA: hypothetical protein PLT49_01465, partial [Ferruginibacter sp.]|nr:hypothetical protein [Ferruginibacter sp.]HNN70959.1 hypothetical protein [Ferruginibacter sp.]
MRKICLFVFLGCYSMAACHSAPRSKEEKAQYADSVRVVKSGLTYPWEILWGKDGFIWMTERGG